VAALTILPDVRQVSIAWKKWFKCASKLRRLRFIRKQLRQRKEGQNGVVEVVFDDQQHFNQQQQQQHSRSDKSPGDGAYASSKSSEKADEMNNIFNEEWEQHHQYLSRDNNSTDTTYHSSNQSLSSSSDSATMKTSSPRVPPRTNTPRNVMPLLETVDEGSSDGVSIDESSMKRMLSSSTVHSLSNSAMDETIKHQTTSRTRTNTKPQLLGIVDQQQPQQLSSSDPGSTTPFPKYLDRLEQQHNFNDSSLIVSPPRGGRPQSVSLPSDSAAGSRKEEFLASVGLHEEAKLENFLSEYDIEQLTVYCREFARTSAMCCPFGCDEYTIRHADAATLSDMEIEAEEAVREASDELRRARAEVHRFDSVAMQDSGLSQPSDPLHQADGQENSKLINLMVGNGNGHGSDVVRNDVEFGCSGNTTTSDGGRIMDTVPLMSTMTRYWEEAESLVEKEGLHSGRGLVRRKRKLSTGEWALPIFHAGAKVVKSAAQTSGSMTGKVASKIVRTDSYAVVTFTSRQAAIAARQCLADCSGLDRWLELEDIPTPSLSDAPPWNICDCRGCCRPVTLTLPQEQKRWRQNFVILFIVLFCFLYTIPLT
jgi:hypothetical protein